MPVCLGVDPGLNGGLAKVAVGMTTTATFVRPTCLGVADIPTTGDKAKRRVNVAALLAWIRLNPPDHAYIERAQSMPDQGSSSGFIYGRAVGALEACIQGLLIPLTIIEPTAWKKAHSLVGRDKEDSRQRAIMLFPNAAGFERKMDHGRAEAALIAWYGCMLSRQNAVAAE